MKPFFAPDTREDTYREGSIGAHVAPPIETPFAIESSSGSPSWGPLQGRIAIYDSPAAAPRVEDVVAETPDGFIEELASRTYRSAREQGGSLPYTVVREVVENLIHADFREPVVSILDEGSTIRFSDQGPGIPDKDRALLPGYTTATNSMKTVIRGVGSGLPLVREFLAHGGGSLQLEDNLGAGTVATLKGLRPQAQGSDNALSREPEQAVLARQDVAAVTALSTRQKRVLSLVLEFGEAGPTLVSKELGVGLSTAYRDLAHLEENGLITALEAGKREITELGHAYLDTLLGQ